MYAVILEPDRIIAKLLKKQLAMHSIPSSIAPTPNDAMKMIDDQQPDVLITELSLRGHSALEFLYELRTYADMQYIGILIYSSLLLEETVLQSKDWSLLQINSVFYKPHTSINAVVEQAAILLEK